ncbi:MAG: hypothetical protein IPL62_06725 [Caulobacteraceae bacterium]|nr:hypothetical protein [Caulobacteraceae bacterium]
MLAHRRVSPRALCDCYARAVTEGPPPRGGAGGGGGGGARGGGRRFGFPQASVRLRSYERR